MTMRLEYKKTSTLLLNDDVLKELIKVGNLRTRVVTEIILIQGG